MLTVVFAVLTIAATAAAIILLIRLRRQGIIYYSEDAPVGVHG